MENEKRLIDANAYPCRGCGHEYCYQNCQDFIKWFNNTVDAVEVVHGRWINSRGEIVPLDEGCPVSSCNCSVCGEWLTASDEYACFGKYCPNCGAKMDGGNEDV
jgi:hypothetical protein